MFHYKWIPIDFSMRLKFKKNSSNCDQFSVLTLFLKVHYWNFNETHRITMFATIHSWRMWKQKWEHWALTIITNLCVLYKIPVNSSVSLSSRIRSENVPRIDSRRLRAVVQQIIFDSLDVPSERFMMKPLSNILLLRKLSL